MSYLFYRLILFLNTASKDDLNYTICEFVLKNIDEIPKMNIVDFAKNCHVSPASISRFCRKLGFDDYAHLKSECGRFKGKKLNEYQDQNIGDSPDLVLTDFIANQKQHLSSLEQVLNFDELDEFIDEIFASNTIALFGSHFSHSVAQLLQTNLVICTKYCLAKNELEQQIKIAESLTENDMAIIISVKGNYVHANQRLARALKKTKAKIVYITANHEECLKHNSHRVLYISDNSNVYMGGRYVLLSYIEILCARIITLYKASL